MVPFAYHGLRDDIDYEQIPGGTAASDPAALAAAVQTQRRIERLWRVWAEHPGTRTLVFCCSIPHARFARDWLRERGVRVEAIFSGAGSGDRERCLDQLAKGDLEALCVVDIFNEGRRRPGSRPRRHAPPDRVAGCLPAAARPRPRARARAGTS